MFFSYSCAFFFFLSYIVYIISYVNLFAGGTAVLSGRLCDLKGLVPALIFGGGRNHERSWLW